MEMTVNEVRLRCTSMVAHNEMEGLNEDRYCVFVGK